jgi:hypothetical protein
MAGEEASDEAIRRQMEEIKAEAAKRDFVCEREEISVLAAELKHDSAEQKAKSLASLYCGIRRVRGDGNCRDCPSRAQARGPRLTKQASCVRSALDC